MRTMKNISNKQSGAVSLFVVIFAMLLITVVTVSFLRLMMSDQQQASNADLSQSAYDSAMAGVEDAKRALLNYQTVCLSSPSSCGSLSDHVSSDICNVGVSPVGTTTNPGERLVQQSASGTDAELNQAYTCVKIQLLTEDYIGTLFANKTQLIPLIGEEGRTFDTVTISWYSREDLSDPSGTMSWPASVGTQKLVNQTSWPNNRPSVMRVQAIQVGDTFRLSDFDIENASGQSNANTVILYPTNSASGSTATSFTARDWRKTSATDDPDRDLAPNSPVSVHCESSLPTGGYACSMSLTLPSPIGGGERNAFLRVTPFYNATHFQTVLSLGVPDSTGSNIVRFKDVQPIVDSTGRANDILRRVQSRVDLYDTTAPYPDATIDITGNFCKDFGVTNTDYLAGDCAP